jgi:putative colanic acid biosynthesis acetyltransferase WcaF
MRLFHKGRMRFTDYGHGQREATEGRVGTLDVPYLHHGLSKGLTEYIDRHNRYSTDEALQALESIRSGDFSVGRLFSANSVTRRRAFKELLYRIPYRAELRYIYTLFVRGAILEGRAGLTYAQLQNLYDRMITLKLRLLRNKVYATMPDFEKDTLPKVRTQMPPPDDGSGDVQRARIGAETLVPTPVTDAAGPIILSDRATSDQTHHSGAPPMDSPVREPGGGVGLENGVAGGSASGSGGGLGGSSSTGRIIPVVDTAPTRAEPGQLTPESTPWTVKQRILRAIWMLVGKPIFRASFHNWYGLRAVLLRLFGAKVGKDVRIRPTVNIEVPWNLNLHDGVTVGDYAILYSLGLIEIGSRTIVSQYAHICAGTHDYTDRRFPLIRDPVIIGADAWIGADAFVGPNVKIGRLSVLGARSSVYKDMEPETVYVGNPARPIKKRTLH